MQAIRVEKQFGAHSLILETGKIAKQAHGAVIVRFGDTMTLCTAVEGSAESTKDFFPLVVDYREKTYAAGKFPGGFMKREGRPTTKEILTSRLIDRPIRPLFPADYLREVQVMASTLSCDRDFDPDVLAMIGSSAALHISQIPFLQPTGSVRIAKVGGELVAFPTYAQIQESELDLIVAGTKDAITMIEGFAKEIPEDQVYEAIMFAHDQIRIIVDLIHDLRKAMGLPTKELPAASAVNPLIEEFKSKFYDEFAKRKQTSGKAERYAAIKELKDEIKKKYLPEGVEKPVHTPAQVSGALGWLEERIVRDLILAGKRIDGRDLRQVRPLYCEVSTLPRVHGSALFQRGETQALVTTVLGTSSDEQRVDGITDEITKKFMLDYNFPPFSVGECKPNRGPGRREIGHGALAERSLQAVIPTSEAFPYTIRLVSDIMESNGSSSMASVCGGTLALMDAGVPITNPVAGISIGLVKEKDKYTLLTDIMGDEDHYGDMDFKVAGTGIGITAIQLDLKIDGIGADIIKDTLEQARVARRDILRTMLSTLRQPRATISAFAPRLLTVKINPEKIGALIGPGGKNIKGIQESTGAKIDIKDDGTVFISHSDSKGAEAARAKVESITEEVKIGKIYEGKVSSVKDFGAFIEILPGRDGLCHISELEDKFISKVEEVCKVGDVIEVKVIAIDEHDRIKLSRKVILRERNPNPQPEGQQQRPQIEGGGDRGDRDRGDRDRGDRGHDRGDRDRGDRGHDRGGDRDRGDRGDRGGHGGGSGGHRGDRGDRGGDHGGRRHHDNRRGNNDNRD
ncbi:MAG: polyribonucleotide nucleotidyltransferase [Planctomycetota bacterium]|jgi:polyribonucleotide nucleotidyltransferase